MILINIGQTKGWIIYMIRRGEPTKEAQPLPGRDQIKMILINIGQTKGWIIYMIRRGGTHQRSAARAGERSNQDDTDKHWANKRLDYLHDPSGGNPPKKRSPCRAAFFILYRSLSALRAEAPV
jgi:hypothetical protein